MLTEEQIKEELEHCKGVLARSVKRELLGENELETEAPHRWYYEGRIDMANLILNSTRS